MKTISQSQSQVRKSQRQGKVTKRRKQSMRSMKKVAKIVCGPPETAVRRLPTYYPSEWKSKCKTCVYEKHENKNGDKCKNYEYTRIFYEAFKYVNEYKYEYKPGMFDKMLDGDWDLGYYGLDGFVSNNRKSGELQCWVSFKVKFFGENDVSCMRTVCAEKGSEYTCGAIWDSVDGWFVFNKNKDYNDNEANWLMRWCLEARVCDIAHKICDLGKANGWSRFEINAIYITMTTE